MEQIQLSPKDDLYVLGDVIDRHAYGIELLQRIMDMPNAHMLLGNHEYMMMESLRKPEDSDLREQTVIFGHMPTEYYQSGRPLRIWRRESRIGVDCGCAYRSGGRLGCLRLEDMRELYSKS